MSAIQLIKDGKTINLEEHPSLLALLHAQHRAIATLNEEYMALSDELSELRERKQLYRRLGMRTNGVSRRENAVRNRMTILEAQIKAFSDGYAEIPNLRGERLQDEHFWGDTLSVDTPIDVVRALKHAKDQKLFEEFRVIRPMHSMGRDPIIVGVIGDAHFYIASWR